MGRTSRLCVIYQMAISWVCGGYGLVICYLSAGMGWLSQVIDWLWAGYGLAMAGYGLAMAGYGLLYSGCQPAMGWLSAIYKLAIDWLWDAYGLSINYL